MTWEWLYDEFVSSVGKVSARHIEWALRHGVPDEVLYGLHTAPLGVSNVQTDRYGMYAPTDEGGVGALVFPVAEVMRWEPQDIVDLAAWIPSRPDTVWTRRRAASFIGQENLERALFFGDPIRVNATPFSWLKEGMAGCVIIDWSLNLKISFGGAASVEAETEQLMRAIRKNMIEKNLLPPVIHAPSTGMPRFEAMPEVSEADDAESRDAVDDTKEESYDPFSPGF